VCNYMFVSLRVCDYPEYSCLSIFIVLKLVTFTQWRFTVKNNILYVSTLQVKKFSIFLL